MATNSKPKASKANKAKTVRRTRTKQKYPIVRIALRAEANNSIVTLTDLQGKVIAWSSSGKVGFKGTKKSTPFAAQKATEEILERVKGVDASTVHLLIHGHGAGRDSFLRTIQSSDLQIESIQDVTGFPFGGVKPKNRRRV